MEYVAGIHYNSVAAPPAAIVWRRVSCSIERRILRRFHRTICKETAHSKQQRILIRNTSYKQQPTKLQPPGSTHYSKRTQTAVRSAYNRATEPHTRQKALLQNTPVAIKPAAVTSVAVTAVAVAITTVTTKIAALLAATVAAAIAAAVMAALTRCTAANTRPARTLAATARPIAAAAAVFTVYTQAAAAAIAVMGVCTGIAAYISGVHADCVNARRSVAPVPRGIAVAATAAAEALAGALDAMRLLHDHLATVADCR